MSTACMMTAERSTAMYALRRNEGEIIACAVYRSSSATSFAEMKSNGVSKAGLILMSSTFVLWLVFDQRITLHLQLVYLRSSV